MHPIQYLCTVRLLYYPYSKACLEYTPTQNAQSSGVKAFPPATSRFCRPRIHNTDTREKAWLSRSNCSPLNYCIGSIYNQLASGPSFCGFTEYIFNLMGSAVSLHTETFTPMFPQPMVLLPVPPPTKLADMTRIPDEGSGIMPPPCYLTGGGKRLDNLYKQIISQDVSVYFRRESTAGKLNIPSGTFLECSHRCLVVKGLVEPHANTILNPLLGD